MIIRDWQRLAWHIGVGPPLAYFVGLIALSLMLLIPAAIQGGDAAMVVLILFIAMPAFPLSYVIGGVPFLLIGIAGCLIARFVRGEAQRLWISIPLGALPLLWMAIVMVGPEREFDSAELNSMIIACAPIGGAIAALTCTWFTERFGSRKGLPEDYL